jgi:hypothetical protein
MLSAADAAERAGLPEDARTLYKVAAQQRDFGKYS